MLGPGLEKLTELVGAAGPLPQFDIGEGHTVEGVGGEWRGGVGAQQIVVRGTGSA